MKPHDILKVKNAMAGSASYVTESIICSLGTFKCTVLVSTKFVTKLCPEMLIWSVSADHNLYLHEALLKKRMSLKEMLTVQNNVQYKLH